MTRRILGRSCAMVLLALLLGAIQSTGTLASPAHITGWNQALAADADGDGIPDDLDPDDNNDGIPDSDQGGDGVTPGNDPLPDLDNDGITDDLDPDDNNNAVTDDDEPVPSPSNGGSSGSGGSSSSGAGGGSDQPLVRSLPVTGTGNANPSLAPQFAVVAAISALVMAITLQFHALRYREVRAREAAPSHR